MPPIVPIPLVIHEPHASTAIPPDAMADFTVGTSILRRFVARITDHFTDELFELDLSDSEDVSVIKHEISRVVVDPERFSNDSDEPMAVRGYGVLYERGDDLSTIRPPVSRQRREELLDRWYHPHHNRLSAVVDAALARSGRVLIIDAHSFPDLPMPFDLDQRTPRPDACIGTCGMHTPPELVGAAKAWCAKQGWSLGIDWPYAGTIVPLRHLDRTPAVMSIMVEINRRCYMHLDGDDAIRNDGHAATKDFVTGLVNELRAAASQVALKESAC